MSRPLFTLRRPIALSLMLAALVVWMVADLHAQGTDAGLGDTRTRVDASPRPDAGARTPDARDGAPGADARATRDTVTPGVDARTRRDGGIAVPVDAPSDEATTAPPDAARRRRMRPDAALPDAPEPDDAGVPGDGGLDDLTAGVPEDAGVEEVVPVDAGVDAAPEIDAGSEAEARAIDAPVVEAPPEGPPASAESTVFALKLIFGLAMLLALAYIGGHPRVRRLEEQLGLRGVVLAGFPFIALGVLASLPSVGILSDDVVPKLRPVLQFGLGWIGFIIGAQLDIRVLDRVPRGSAYLLLVESLVPFAVTALVCGGVMIGVFGLSLHDMAAWRDIVLLGTAAAMTAPIRFRGFAIRTWYEGRGPDHLLGQLDEIVGVIGLLFIMAYFRDDSTSAWQLPRTAWLFVTVGLGVIIGVLIFATIRVPRSNAEFLAIVLGSVAFASGLASVLRLSPLVVCFIVGVLITNFPNEQRDSVFRILNRLERPIYLLFLMIAGALWSVFDWRGWALVPLFLACRIFGKWLGIAMTRFSLGEALPPEFACRRRLVLPMSTLAIALVVSIERFRDVGLNWVVTAVIGSAIVTEMIVSLSGDDEDDRTTGAPAHPYPIDELDDDRDPPARSS